MPTKNKPATRKASESATRRPTARRHPAELATGFMTSRMLHVATKLGIAEILGEGEAASDELARATGSHPPSLARLLAGLVDIGFLAENEDGRFRLTATGRCLRRDHPRSIASLVLQIGEPHLQAAWTELAHAVRTGGSAFYYALGAEYWTYVGRHPDAGAGALERLSPEDRVAIAAHDFSAVETLVDVGGGRGEQLAAILGRNRNLKGILFDLPALADAASALFASAGLAERVSFVGGDFFTGVPSGGDLYLVADVLRDWSDADALRILRNCRRAMELESRLMLVEAPAAESPRIADLHRMVLFGSARERSAEELEKLVRDTGFEVERVVAAPFQPTILEASPTKIETREN